MWDIFGAIEKDAREGVLMCLAISRLAFDTFQHVPLPSAAEDSVRTTDLEGRV